MDKQNLAKKLKSIDQEHIIAFWNMLSPHEKHLLAKEVESLDETTFRKQQKLIHTTPKIDSNFTPFNDYSLSGSAEDAAVGQKVISDGCLGCLIVAGGQGTRLNFKGPKGMYPISPIKHKTLFQLFAEKTLAASTKAGKPLPIAIMTSPSNHDQTLNYFEEHHYFGLSPGQVDFFPQTNLPFLDTKGNLFLETPFKIAQGPDGNGSSLSQFFKSGIWERWYANDVRFLNFVLIDNPLADPYDNELLGFHYRRGADVTIKCISKIREDEKVGLLVGDWSKVRVIEYSEIPLEERNAKLNNHTLKHHCANISLFCMNMEFVQRISMSDELPLHLALKPAKYLSKEGITIENPKPNAWKYERFIFDILPLAQKVAALMVPREACFAPLKGSEGEGSPNSVKIALLQQDKSIIAKITGLPAPNFDFELSQDFYYPTAPLLKKWHGKTPSNTPYITP